MSITIPGGLADEFGRAGEPVVVRGPDGRILGTFTPLPPEPEISEEELQRIESDKSGKWYTAAEVEAKLRELRCTR
jgi:hypothetical protein